MEVYKLKGTGPVDIKEAVKKGLIIPKNPSEIDVRPVDMPRQGRFITGLKKLLNL